MRSLPFRGFLQGEDSFEGPPSHFFVRRIFRKALKLDRHGKRSPLLRSSGGAWSSFQRSFSP